MRNVIDTELDIYTSASIRRILVLQIISIDSHRERSFLSVILIQYHFGDPFKRLIGSYH